MTFADCAALRMWRQKTRAKGAVKGSTSLRKMGSSTSSFSSVGLRRPPAFGLPVPLRAQSLGYGSVQRSAFCETAHSSGERTHIGCPLLVVGGAIRGVPPLCVLVLSAHSLSCSSSVLQIRCCPSFFLLPLEASRLLSLHNFTSLILLIKSNFINKIHPLLTLSLKIYKKKIIASTP